MGKRVALSWSGGKDSCMAFDLLVKQGYEVACLLTTVPKEIGRTFGHDEKTELIELQSEALSLPLHFVRCSLDRYTETFIEDLAQLKEQFQLEGIAFGDIYLDGHREWGENVADAVGLPALYPLWSKEEDSLQLLQNFIESGYKAVVIRIRLDVLDDTWLGRQLNEDFYVDIQSQTLCPMGEHGEFHTFVYDGPLFTHPIPLTHGEIITSERSKRLDIQPLIN
ncbi:diphthine--ammonia ligase [Bacillus sp. FJAT-52991]|uniref:Diphthine--ammonia ligase n=1 Tax=Bacillus kandeliae TaxID=3129297 RepID=A0ABZ2N8X5_9BACI